MTRAATYLRVSTEDQAERYGLAAQRYALAAALPGRRYTFVREYVDEGVSGATERRPHLDQCLADARAGQFDVLLTYDSSRLARDGRLWTNLVHGFGLAGVRVEYLTLPRTRRRSASSCAGSWPVSASSNARRSVSAPMRGVWPRRGPGGSSRAAGRMATAMLEGSSPSIRDPPR